MFMHTDEIERLVGLAYEMETSKDKNLCLERIAELFELERAAQADRAAEKNGELDAFRYTIEAPALLTKEQKEQVKSILAAMPLLPPLGTTRHTSNV